jgi:2-phosphoglycerate kinase
MELGIVLGRRNDMNKIVGIGGVPATGKTTLVLKIINDHGPFEYIEPVKMVRTLYNKKNDFYILGVYNEEGYAKGTDKLSMAVQPKVIEFLSKIDNCRVLFEGDRLFNESFINSIRDDNEIKMLILNANNNELQNRHISRSDNQSKKFLKGRTTKYVNMMISSVADCIDCVMNNTEEDQSAIISDIENFLGL